MSEDEEPPCPYCGSEVECSHLLAGFDDGSTETEGFLGLLGGAFAEDRSVEKALALFADRALKGVRQGDEPESGLGKAPGRVDESPSMKRVYEAIYEVASDVEGSFGSRMELGEARVEILAELRGKFWPGRLLSDLIEEAKVGEAVTEATTTSELPFMWSNYSVWYAEEPDRIVRAVSAYVERLVPLGSEEGEEPTR